MRKPRSVENKVVSAIFVGTVFCFSIASIFSCVVTKTGRAETENRMFASFPQLHTLRKDIFVFAPKFEAFFNDRVAGRLPIISARNAIAYHVFHASGNHLVALGQDGWLFYDDGYSISKAQHNSEPFTADELSKWANALEARREFCAKHNIKYLLVLAPEKGSIYPEQLPIGWKRGTGPSRLEQLQDYLRKNTTVDFVDAEALLKAEKRKEGLLYFKNDSHWNSIGCLLVACEMLKHIAVDCPGTRTLNMSDFRIDRVPYVGDLSNMLGLRTETMDPSCPTAEAIRPSAATQDTTTPLPFIEPGGVEPAKAFRTADSRLPRAFVLRDSFSSVYLPYISDCFSFIEYQWTNCFLPQTVLDEKPNVVINEIAERHLYEHFGDHVPVFLSNAGGVDSVGQSNPGAVSQTAGWGLSPASTRGQTPDNTVTFDDRFELRAISAKSTDRGLLVQMLWHAKKDLKLEYTVGVHCLDSKEKLVSGNDFDQDVIQRQVAAGASWTDTMLVPKSDVPATVKKIGLVIYKRNAENLMATDTNGFKWGARFVTPMEAIKSNSAKFETACIASGGSPPI